MQSSTAAPPLLLSPASLSSLLAGEKKPRILDATWFMPGVTRNAGEEFTEGPRLPNSSFWDVEDVADRNHPLGLKHMMPRPETFAEASSSLGIDNETHVVVYDTHGFFSSPRTAFTFYAYGHRNISILNGGLPAWVAASLPLEVGPPRFKPSRKEYRVTPLKSGIIRSYDEMIANAKLGSCGQTVLDARPAGRFKGTAPEPRPALSSGHIPSSLSLPFSELLQKHHGYTTLKEQAELWQVISDAVGGLEVLNKIKQVPNPSEAGITATCGSGMTAAVIWAGLRRVGIEASIYDESWAGYAQRKESPVEKFNQD